MGQRTIEIYAGQKWFFGRKQWRARVVAANGFDVLFVSSESYNNRQYLVDLCEDLFPDLPINIIDE